MIKHWNVVIFNFARGQIMTFHHTISLQFIRLKKIQRDFDISSKSEYMIHLVDSFLDAMLKNVGGKPKIINDSLSWIFQLLITKLSINLTSFSLYTSLVIPDNKFCTIHILSFFKKIFKCLLKASGNFLQFQCLSISLSTF